MKLPEGYLPVEEWYRWPDGTLNCWWCAAVCHPDTAVVHDQFHRNLEQDQPIALWHQST